jgi:hypothetical protein
VTEATSRDVQAARRDRNHDGAAQRARARAGHGPRAGPSSNHDRRLPRARSAASSTTAALNGAPAKMLDATPPPLYAATTVAAVLPTRMGRRRRRRRRRERDTPFAYADHDHWHAVLIHGLRPGAPSREHKQHAVSTSFAVYACAVNTPASPPAYTHLGGFTEGSFEPPQSVHKRTFNPDEAQVYTITLTRPSSSSSSDPHGPTSEYGAGPAWAYRAAVMAARASSMARLDCEFSALCSLYLPPGGPPVSFSPP